MSSSLKERIISTLLVGVVFFMLLCITYKLFDYREDWLPYSLMWAVSWSIGYFVSKTISKAIADESIIKVILIEALISLVVALIISFILGVMIGLSNWAYVVSNTCIPFAASLLLHNKYKRS